MRTGLLRTLAFVFVAVLGAIGATADASHDAFPGRDGLIAVVMRQSDLVFVTPQGHVVKRIHKWARANGNSDPVWSRDGRSLAYGQFRHAGDSWVIEAWLADGAGRPIKRLVNETETEANCGTVRDDDLSWSPDGTRLVFSATRITRDDPPVCRHFYELWTVTRSGGQPQLLLTADRPPWDGCLGLSSPAWSPRGDEIAFVGREFRGRAPGGDSICRSNIFISHADGSGLRQLTHTIKPDGNTTRVYGHLEWSPDGTKLLFTHDYSAFAPVTEMVIGADGKGERRIYRASWAPDGHRVVFVAPVRRKFKTPAGIMARYNPGIFVGTLDCAVAAVPRGVVRGPACSSARMIWYAGPRTYYELVHFGYWVEQLAWQPLR